MSETNSPKNARQHARAQENEYSERVVNKPILPASAATQVPGTWSPEDLIWAETLCAGDYASHVLPRGSVVRFTNTDGDACVHLLLHNADATQERLNVADTLKVQWQAYLGVSSCLLSDMGRSLMSVVTDTCRGHDLLCGHSNRMINANKYGHGDNHTTTPNARDRFILALQKLGLGRIDICPSLALFKRVRIAEDGELIFERDAPVAGEFVELRADMNVIVTIVNAPHVLDPRTEYVSTRVDVMARCGDAPKEDDAIRMSSPERRRAFENVDDWYAS